LWAWSVEPPVACAKAPAGARAAVARMTIAARAGTKLRIDVGMSPVWVDHITSVCAKPHIGRSSLGRCRHSVRAKCDDHHDQTRNFCILRSGSHVARFIDPPPLGGRKPDKSCATYPGQLTCCRQTINSVASSYGCAIIVHRKLGGGGKNANNDFCVAGRALHRLRVDHERYN
jgi:hypothetical protein